MRMFDLIGTEVKIKGEAEHVVVPRDELARLLGLGSVAAVYKMGSFGREDVIGETKALHITKWKGSSPERPRARAVITSGVEDRAGDVIDPKGMQVDAYLMNPVILPFHAHGEFPIGMATQIRQGHKGVMAEWEWLTDQDYTLAKLFQQAWDAYVLNCTSIGMLPIQAVPYEKGFQFQLWELLEASVVVLPANREAMRTRGLGELLTRAEEAVMTGPSPVLKSMWQEAPRTIQVSIDGKAVASKVIGAGDVPKAKEQAPQLIVEKPYPSEHSCRLKSPDDFEDDSFRRDERDHDGKKYSVIYGRLKGEKTLTEQAYRYPKKTWDVGEAKGHCEGHKGSFEAASEDKEAQALIERLSGELEASEAENECLRRKLDEWKSKCAELAARVVFRGGGIRG